MSSYIFFWGGGIYKYCLRSFAPVTMKSVCQMPSPMRGMMPLKSPPMPSVLTMLWNTWWIDCGVSSSSSVQ